MYETAGKYRKLIQKDHLQSLGLYQVRTYSLVSEKEINTFNEEDKETIALLLPMSEDKKYMRKSILPSLINVVDYNLARSIKDISIMKQVQHIIKKKMNILKKKKYQVFY